MTDLGLRSGPPVGTAWGARGRRIECECCGQRVQVKPPSVWKHHRLKNAQLRVLFADRDGAVVEQVGREWDGRFGIGYRDLLRNYRRVSHG